MLKEAETQASLYHLYDVAGPPPINMHSLEHTSKVAKESCRQLSREEHLCRGLVLDPRTQVMERENQLPQVF